MIDFNSDLPSSAQHSRHPSQHFHQEPEYVNGDIPNPRKSSNRDPFDMSKTWGPIIYFIEVLHLAGALMEHFLEEIAPLRHCYLYPNEKSNKYKSSLLS